MATYELLGLNEATPRAVAPTASDTGVVSNLTVTTNLTNTAGTANGVTYLNASKVLTSGSGLVFDGTYLRLGAGTGGVQFNGDTAAANALDDYEEGTWTPTVGGTATYIAQDGYYTKIGNFVKIRFRLNVDLIGTGSATTISGIPFNASNNSPSIVGGVVCYVANLATSALCLGIYAQGGSINFFSRNANDTSATVQLPAVIGNGFHVFAEISYMA